VLDDAKKTEPSVDDLPSGDAVISTGAGNPVDIIQSHPRRRAKLFFEPKAGAIADRFAVIGSDLVASPPYSGQVVSVGHRIRSTDCKNDPLSYQKPLSVGEPVVRRSSVSSPGFQKLGLP